MSEAHMGLVAALRESSVVFAAVLGASFLKERVRWLGVALVFAGILFARLADEAHVVSGFGSTTELAN
jgi:uncharacterized membrane protein